MGFSHPMGLYHGKQLDHRYKTKLSSATLSTMQSMSGLLEKRVKEVDGTA
jgi:hypothetical protein